MRHSIHPDNIDANFFEGLFHDLMELNQVLKSGALGIKQYLPDLISAYRLANPTREDGVIPSTKLQTLSNISDSWLNLTAKVENQCRVALQYLFLTGVDQSMLKLCSITDAVAELKQEHPAMVSRCHFDLDDMVFDYLGDAELTKMMLWQLIDNALWIINKSASDSDVLICADELDDCYNLSIADAVGDFDPNALANCFQAKNTTRQEHLGMGLFLCQQIMSLYGGAIRVNSQPGEFSCVTLVFPKARPQQQYLDSTTHPLSMLNNVHKTNLL